ncbi:MAG: TonB-dependent receptor [Chitinophagaceae bacterium]|nr:TonB-dependent receptor [Chitinophagaceae bacterium]
MKKLFSVITIMVLLMLTQSAFARLREGVKGNVKNGTKPIAGATISLLNAKDSSLVKLAVTNNDGAFEIEQAKPGEYLILAQAINYNDYYSRKIHLNSEDALYDMADIQLEETSKNLNAVTVTTSKPFIEQKIDRTVINVANSITSAGSTVWELLQKSPGVAVNDNDNSISLQGKSGVVVFIDGKPTYMSQDQLANMLKNMDANNIQSIELMPHPPAQYDAAGNAGVINIITKKSKIKGTSGSVSASYGQGVYSNQSISGNITHRTGKINLFGNLSDYKYEGFSKQDIGRNFYDANTDKLSLISRQTTNNHWKGNYFEYKAGMDYYITEKQTLGILLNGAGSPRHQFNTTISNFYDPQNVLQSTVYTRNNFDPSHWHNNTADLNYKIEMDSLGKSFAADFSYTKFNSSGSQLFSTYPDSIDYAQQTNAAQMRGSLPSNINIFVGKIDYVHPIDKDTKIEAGAKTSFVTTDNNVRYDSLTSGQWQLSNSLSNHFKYTENINAAYINFSKQFKKGWSLQLGLRGEQTVSKGEQITIDSTVNRNYFQLFPTAFVQKKIGDNHTFGVNYSRRIDRPDYQDLNPFRYYLDKYTYGVGNPFLQPQITNSLGISYSFKSYLNAEFSYSKTSQAMSQVLYQNTQDSVTYQTNSNLNTVKNISLNLSSSVAVTKWFNTNNSLNIFRNSTEGIYQTVPINFHQTSFQFNSTNTFKLPKDYAIELSGFYNSKALYSTIYVWHQAQISLGAQKSFLKNKNATIKLNVRDPFNMLYNHATSRVGYLMDLYSIAHWDNRRVTLTFSYRFSKGAKVKEHNNSSNDEQNRIRKN